MPQEEPTWDNLVEQTTPNTEVKELTVDEQNKRNEELEKKFGPKMGDMEKAEEINKKIDSALESWKDRQPKAAGNDLDGLESLCKDAYDLITSWSDKTDEGKRSHDTLSEKMKALRVVRDKVYNHEVRMDSI